MKEISYVALYYYTNCNGTECRRLIGLGFCANDKEAIKVAKNKKFEGCTDIKLKYVRRDESENTIIFDNYSKWELNKIKTW